MAVAMALLVGASIGCDSEPQADPGSADAAAETGVDGAGAAGAGGGAAGVGGTCSAGPNEFAHCGAKQPPSTCTLEATCAATGCGPPESLLDDQGCLRTSCRAEDECGPGERCLPTALVTPGCRSSDYSEGCSPTYGDACCTCNDGADCAGLVHCVPETLAPYDQDCSFVTWATCAELISSDGLYTRATDLSDPPLVKRLQDCMKAVDAAIAAKGC